MNEELEKENSQTTEEEETSEQETSAEEQETQETPEPQEEDKQTDQLYARLKKAEAKNKALAKKLAEAGDSKVDIAELAQKMSALSGLDETERQRVLKESKLQDVSLGEARKSEDFKLWKSAYRAKLEKAKSPKPSTKQELSETEKTYDQMNDAEFEKAAVEGLSIIDPATGKVRKVSLLDRGLRGRLLEQHKGG